MAQYRLSTPQGNVLVEAPEGASKAEVIRQYNATVAYGFERDARENQAQVRARLQAPLDKAVRTSNTREAGLFDYVQEVPKGIVGGAANLLEQGALGLATLLPESAELVVRDGIQSIGGAVQDYVSPDINLGDSVPRKFSEAVGSFAGIVGTSLVNPLAGAGLAVTAGVGEASERARAGGATQEERNLAALQGIIPGALELIPAGRLVKGIKQVFKGDANPVVLITNRILRATREGGFEAGQEVASSIAQNMIEQGYNPEQGTFEGSGEAAGYGFGVGALAQSLLDLATPRTRGGTGTAVEQQARAVIGEALDTTGAVPYETLRDTDFGTLLPEDVQRIVEEEAAKRDIDFDAPFAGPSEPIGQVQDQDSFDDAILGKLYSREESAAQAEPSEAQAAPDNRPFQERLAASVADAKSGVGAVQGIKNRAPQQRAEARALERDDVAAYEQPDLFPQDLEKARRDPRGRTLQNVGVTEKTPEPRVELDEQGGVREVPAAPPMKPR